MEGTIHFLYLGVPIFFRKPREAHLRPIAEKIMGKFDHSSGSILSLTGRVCLINSVITSSLTHCMKVYRWPRKLLKKVNVGM